ncbi:MAG: helix-turn-helix transcriptional regulator [Chloroflexota bacterium]
MNDLATLAPLAVSISEAARLAGCGKSFFYRELRLGNIKLPLVRLGGKTVIRVADIQSWLAAQVSATE